MTGFNRRKFLKLTGGGAVAAKAGGIAAILASAVWQPNISFDVFGTKLALQNLLRDAADLSVLRMHEARRGEMRFPVG